MSYIPENAHWYVAEILEEINVEEAANKIVHRNLVLVEANSPDQAYERAMELGKQGEASYQNSEGQNVIVRFLGLADLSVVYDELEHGAELAYTEQVVQHDEDTIAWVCSKNDLSVFRSTHKLPTELDYGDRAIVDEAMQLLKGRTS